MNKHRNFLLGSLIGFFLFAAGLLLPSQANAASYKISYGGTSFIVSSLSVTVKWNALGMGDEVGNPPNFSLNGSIKQYDYNDSWIPIDQTYKDLNTYIAELSIGDNNFNFNSNNYYYDYCGCYSTSSTFDGIFSLPISLPSGPYYPNDGVYAEITFANGQTIYTNTTDWQGTNGILAVPDCGSPWGPYPGYVETPACRNCCYTRINKIIKVEDVTPSYSIAAYKSHINLSPSAFPFTGTSGGATPLGQTLTIQNIGNAVLNWTASFSQGWCHLNTNSGVIGIGSSQNVTVSVDAPSNVGTFTCNIYIVDANADNSPQTATVTYTVSAALAGTSVTLTANPASGSYFAGWSGACSGAGSCVVSMTQDRDVTATFNLKPVLTVTKSGVGSGIVYSNDYNINCGSDCSESYTSGTSVTLTANPVSGSYFTGWSGACSGTGSCVVSVTQAQDVTATFNFSSNFTLNSSNTIYATLVSGRPRESNATTLTVTPPNGFSSNVSLSVQSVTPLLPAGTTYYFSDSILSSSEYSTGSQFKVNIGSGLTSGGLYTIRILGMDGGLANTVDVYLNIQVKQPGWEEF